MIMIGIDPGVNTGIAVYNSKAKSIEEIHTMKIHDAFELVLMYKPLIKLVRVEDARKRKWFGANSNAKQQGAGSVKRDCKAWDDFLTDKGIPFEMVAPDNVRTKVSEQYFKQLTGIITRTSNHARDAAMLIWGL